VWVRSPWVSRGYLARATGPLRRDGAWSTVGDLADPLPPDGGALVLRGRGDGAILTGGPTVVPEDVEVVLRAVPGVRDVVVLGTAHRRLGAVVSAVVECDDRPGLRAHLERVARGALAPAQRPRRWYGTRALPRTPSGKPARGAVSEALGGADPASAGLAPLRWPAHGACPRTRRSWSPRGARGSARPGTGTARSPRSTSPPGRCARRSTTRARSASRTTRRTSCSGAARGRAATSRGSRRSPRARASRSPV